MAGTADELLVQRHPFSTQGTVSRVVSWKIAADEAEDRLAVHLDGGPAPEAAHTDHLSPQLLDQLDEEVQRRAARDQVLDEQDAGGGPDQPLELDGQRDASLAARQSLGA